MVKRRATNSIELGRTFLEVPDSAEGLDPEEMIYLARALNRGQTWSQLLKHPYVVVLGEAGTGKSTEFERQADSLTTADQWAFFVEINDLASDGLGDSIDADDEARLEAWRNTDDPVVFFLDSLDEAKLQKRTLRQALRRLEKALKVEWGRVRLVISCRASDWRADADRAEVVAVLPEHSTESVHVVQLAPLEDDQVKKLATDVGVGDTTAFMAAIEHRHAQVFVERPLDVRWLGAYWKRHQQIGSLQELVADNIREKLTDRKGRGSTLSAIKAEEGIRALAGIATLTRRHAFLVSDETLDLERSTSAIDPCEVLPDWSDDEIQQLLRRPIFDESTYCRVRLHHRSVREYLAAKWLKDLCDAGMARSKLDDLLFREEAGQRAIRSSGVPNFLHRSQTDSMV